MLIGYVLGLQYHETGECCHELTVSVECFESFLCLLRALRPVRHRGSGGFESVRSQAIGAWTAIGWKG